MKLCDALESVGANRGVTPRTFLESRAAYVQQLVASWNSSPPR
jgi:hypothetical protein